MMVPKITPSNQICHEVKIFVILKRVKHIDQKRVFQLSQQLFFIHDRIHRLFLNDPTLRHFFHSISCFEFFALYLPDFAEATLADHRVELEMGLVDGYKNIN